MFLNWLQSLAYGLITGVTDILPVSSRAHQILLLKLFGVSAGMELMELMIRIGITAALYLCCQKQIVRFQRARALARVPKHKRRRPLDEKSLMDISLLRTMLLPVVLGLLLYRKAMLLQNRLVFIAAALMINGIILYVPQFLPGSNRDSRTLSRVEGLLMGMGGAVGVVPGFSSVGMSCSAGLVCGVEKSYGLNMTLLMNLFMNLGLIVHGIVALASAGAAGLSFGLILRCLVTAAAAFGASMLSIRLLRYLTAERGTTAFGFYSIGLSLFLFILNLMA